MSGHAQSNEQQELGLVEKVELRIALADTAEKFEQQLSTFLAPLLLKLASPHQSVKQAVLQSCNQVILRLNTYTDVKLPIEKLVLQAKSPNLEANVDSSAVILYSLLFVSKGVNRLDDNERDRLLPLILNGVSRMQGSSQARMFHVLCKLLLDWKMPAMGTKAYDEAIETLKIEDKRDIDFWMQRFTEFFLLIPVKAENASSAIPRGYTCPGLSAGDVAFFTYNAGLSFNRDQLTQYKHAVYQFVVDAFVSKDNIQYCKFLSVVSVDSSSISEQAVVALNRVQLPVENEDYINFLLHLFIGDKNNGVPPVTHVLQEKILSILCTSVTATKKDVVIPEIASIGLYSEFRKLKSLTLKFIQHVSKHNYSALARPSEAGDYSTNIAALIRNNIISEGWPKLTASTAMPNFSLAIEQRRAQYETLGEMVKRDFSLFEDLSYAEFLLDALKGDLTDFKASIQEALSSFTIHLPHISASKRTKLKKKLLDIMTTNVMMSDSRDEEAGIMACKYVAIKYVNATFPFSNADARLINVLGTSRTNSFELIEEAYKGLHPYWFRVGQSLNVKEIKPSAELLGTTKKYTDFPSFESYITALLKLIKNEATTGKIRESLNTAIRFALQILITNAVKGSNTIIEQDEDWSLRIERAIYTDEKALKLTHDSISNLSSESYVSFLTLMFKEFIKKDHHGNTVSIFKYEDPIFGNTALTFAKHSSDVVLRQLDHMNDCLFTFIKRYQTTAEADIQCAASLIGIIGSYAPSPFNLTLLKRLDSEDFGNDIPTQIAASYILPRLKLRYDSNCNIRIPCFNLVKTLVKNMKQLTIKNFIYYSLEQILSLGTLLLLNEDERVPILKEITETLRPTLLNNELTITLWAYTTFYINDDEQLNENFSALKDTHVSKHTEFLFTSGEALTIILGGWLSKYLIQKLDVNVPIANLQSVFPGKHLSKGLSEILSGCNSSKPAMRKACCIWLLSLVQYLGHLHDVNERCTEIHLAFMKFLADRDELVQESASKGLGFIYEIGNTDLKEEMMKNLIKSFADPAKTMAMNSGTISAETTLFDANVLNGGDGYISTYKDVLDLASEVGDPSLVYKFMDLARSSNLWSSRKGIAFGLGNIISKNSLEKMLLDDKAMAQKLIPKLFRYRFDPVTSVAKSMNDIWNTLVTDPAKTTQQYFPDILKELLDKMGNTEWRVREASTLALIDLLQKSTIGDYDTQVEAIWTKTFRVMDDIKDSVRESGSRLAQVLSKILVRALDDKNGLDTEKSKRIFDVLLPFLLGPKGLSNDSEEIRKFALKTLMDLIKNVGTRIRPHAPLLVQKLTLSLSFLEPQVNNYLSLNADKFNLTTAHIDDHRARALNGSPVMHTIEKLVNLADDSMVNEMTDNAIIAVKKSVGLISIIASSKILILLAQKYGILMKSYSGKLLKLCYNQFDNSNFAISSAFATSLGHIYKISGLDKTVKYSNKLVSSYFEAEDIVEKRITIGVAIDTIHKYSLKQFEDVQTILVPLLFVAKSNPEERLSSFFTNIWVEIAYSTSSTVKLYFDEIAKLCSEHINSSTFTTRQMCAKSISELCIGFESKLTDKQNDNLFEVLCDASKRRVWDGKECIIAALVLLATKSEPYYLARIDLQKTIKEILIAELNRKNKKYTTQLIIAVCDFLSKYPDDVVTETLISAVISVSPYLKNFNGNGDPKASSEKPTPSMTSVTDVHDKSSKENVEKEKSRVAMLKKLATAASIHRSRSDNNLAEFVLRTTLALLDLTYTWRTQIAVSEIGLQLLDKVDTNLDAVYTEIFDKFWSKVYELNCAMDVIESVKVQLIKFGGKLSSKAPRLSVQIKSQLQDMVIQSKSAILEAELNNVGIKVK
ncbi:HEL258Wp [Eremothecium sinecaudum]|uniref:HEL258Wp n=1 Tax=Eremothecium sinecaudum TaxID=45286 RepID=A0A0X8HTA6_9SACH|nr:HEL258Wp [Eremothecium sinecaudum]AMD21023.1 HEL258Wp [Eremothecium sinecaudum]